MCLQMSPICFLLYSKIGKLLLEVENKCDIVELQVYFEKKTK